MGTEIGKYCKRCEDPLDTKIGFDKKEELCQICINIIEFKKKERES